MTEQRTVRSYRPLTDDDLDRLRTFAYADHLLFQQRHPDWAGELLGCFLAQGGARHLLHGDRGIKDLDVYLLYAVPPGRSSRHFPWNRGGATRNKDFGPSPHGRQLYTDDDRTDPRIAAKIPTWERYAGRRVDIMSRAIDGSSGDARVAVTTWLRRGATKRRAEGATDWNLSRAPLVCLHPRMKETWWQGPAVDEAGIEKGAYGESSPSSPE